MKNNNKKHSEDTSLLDNRKWYAENGTVYNQEDDSFRISMVMGDNSEVNLPNNIAKRIANYLNKENKEKEKLLLIIALLIVLCGFLFYFVLMLW